jgi:hypothetical protein
VRASGGGIPAGLTEGPMLILDDGEETPDVGCQISEVPYLQPQISY